MAVKLKQGEYVVATKYRDGQWEDQWCVGFYHQQLGGVGNDTVRHQVVDSNGRQFRHNGFRRVKRITANEGQLILNNANSYNSVWSLLWHIKGQLLTPA